MWADKAQYRPGTPVVLHVEGESAATVQVSELGHPVATVAVLEGKATWTAPEAGSDSARGFYAEALNEQGQVVETTAFDVAPHWSVAPRYGFLSEFKPTDTAECAAGLNRLHLNVVQYYDWMYTHYQYFAPTDEFVDPLGRQTSHRVVQAKIDACHAYGIASLAYGSMYGGEKPIALEHPEWLLHDGNGQPYHLIDLFYIQNVEQDCPWREKIIAEYAGALKRLDFDGIHIDQYGFPKRAVYRPEPGVERVVDMTEAMPDFVDDACRRLNAIRPDGGSIFNCVNNWPVERVAPLTSDAATYIEVWAPNDTYRDLHELVRYAKAGGRHKQVILSAYLEPFHREHERPAGAMAALKLATAAIYASGGFHLLLGEGNGVLAGAYYPTFGRLSDADLAEVVRYYDFVTAYGELLHDKQLRDVSYSWNGGGFDEETRETNTYAPVATSPMAEAGKVWTLLHEKPGRRVMHLINLHGLEHARWNAPQAEPVPLENIEVQFQVQTPIRAVWCASPDDGGVPQRLVAVPTADGKPYVRIRVPRLQYWTMLWTEE
jgi:dextranase